MFSYRIRQYFKAWISSIEILFWNRCHLQLNKMLVKIVLMCVQKQYELESVG